MTLFFIITAFSFNVESSTVYRNSILSSSLYARNFFSYGRFNLYQEAGWSGKRNLISGSLDEKYNFGILSKFGKNDLRLSADFSKVENFSITTRTQTLKLTAGRETSIGDYFFRTSISPSLEMYSSRTDTQIEAANPGLTFELDAGRYLTFADITAGVAAEIKKLTKKYTGKGEVSLSLRTLQNRISGRIDAETYPVTGGRTKFNRYEILMNGKWNFFGAGKFFAETYWNTKYLSKRYPESDYFSNEDFFAEAGCFVDIYMYGTAFKIDYSQGFGFHSRQAVGDEDIMTSRLLCDASYTNANFSARADAYMSIYRFFQDRTFSYGDYDVSDRGAGLDLAAILNDRLNADVSFFYRENRTVYLSENYSESNTWHRTYSFSAGAFLRPFDWLSIRQNSSIKTDYTFFIYSSDRNVLFRKYENKLEINTDVFPKIQIFCNGSFSIQDRGGYKKIDEITGGKWYFLRNRHVRSFDVLTGVKLATPWGFSKPYGGIEEKAVFMAEGNELGSMESYSLKSYAGLGLEFSVSKGQAVFDLRGIIDDKGEDQWEANFYLLFLF